MFVSGNPSPFVAELQVKYVRKRADLLVSSSEAVET